MKTISKWLNVVWRFAVTMGIKLFGGGAHVLMCASERCVDWHAWLFRMRVRDDIERGRCTIEFKDDGYLGETPQRFDEVLLGKDEDRQWQE